MIESPASRYTPTTIDQPTSSSSRVNQMSVSSVPTLDTVTVKLMYSPLAAQYLSAFFSTSMSTSRLSMGKVDAVSESEWYSAYWSPSLYWSSHPNTVTVLTNGSSSSHVTW